MNTPEILLLIPGQCTKQQLAEFHELVVLGNQVQQEGLKEKIGAASLLAFAYLENQLAGVASIKNQKRSYITGIFLKAKVPRLASAYQYEIGYAVTHPDFRRRGITRELISQLMTKKPGVQFYATTKNDDMRSLLEKSGFCQTGHPYQNVSGETLDLYTKG